MKKSVLVAPDGQIKRASKRKGATMSIAIPDDLAEKIIVQIMANMRGEKPPVRVSGLRLSWDEV